MKRYSSMHITTHTHLACTRWSRLYRFMFLLVVVVIGDDTNTILAEKIQYSYPQGLVDPASGSALPSCGVNERYTTCASSTCFEDTCYDILYYRPRSVMCTKVSSMSRIMYYSVVLLICNQEAQYLTNIFIEIENVGL